MLCVMINFRYTPYINITAVVLSPGNRADVAILCTSAASGTVVIKLLNSLLPSLVIIVSSLDNCCKSVPLVYSTKSVGDTQSSYPSLCLPVF